MFVAWNGFTLIGILSSQLIQTSILNHLEFIVPLTFFMLLMSSIHSQLEMGVAVLAGGLAFVCLAIGVGRVTLLVVAVTVPLVAVLMSKHTTKTDA
jgi:predicted branched-subunit amino acid permease